MPADQQSQCSERLPHCLGSVSGSALASVEGMMSRLIGLLLAALFATAAPAVGQTPKESRLGTIANTKLIKVAYRTDARPFSFAGEGQAPTGYSIDLCKLVVGSIERQIGGSALKIECVPVNMEARFSA